jgi:deoxyribodipyrimidine photo-lyase
LRLGELTPKFFVRDLRESFKKLGSDLTVRIGHPEDIIDNIVNDLAQENITVEGVYSHQEVCDEEMRVEKRLIKRLKTKNVQLKTVWGGQTMHHISELPFIPTGKV